ncbi:MAG: hypothetical protein GXO11_07730 [Epsilonproteobacteria bacterium]|nr:hypothetical protein [Campylobacterota bacterium]
MKLTKMSLVAALLVTSSAFAIDNVKVSGDANIYYSTWDSKAGYAGITDDSTLFNKDNSAADASVNLNITADLVKNDIATVSAGASYTFITTLGLENNFVSNVWGGSHTADLKTGANYGDVLGGAKVNNANWAPEAWVAVSLNQVSKSTLKLGRMELDTPLAFTEKWSIEKNTFEAAVLINQDIPDTTIVGAYVGNGNGNETFGQDETSAVQQLGLATGAIVNAKGKFTTFATDGAYAAGIINNSFKPLTIQAWYYDLTHLATAYWLQADLKCQLVPGLIAGAQYTSIDVDGTDDASGTYAVMAGYDVKDVVTVKAAYSQTDDKGVLHGANTATSTGASKLYTEAWWNYGYVTRLDTSAVTVSVESPVNGLVDIAAYYTAVDVAAEDQDLTEVTLTASKSFGPLDATLAYIFTDAEDQNEGDSYNTVQAYITLNF